MDIKRLHRIQTTATNAEELSRAHRLLKEYRKTNKTMEGEFLYGTVCIQRDEPGIAIESLRESLTINPRFLSGYINLIAAYRAIGDVERARDQGEMVIDRILPTYANERDPQIIGHIAGIYCNTASAHILTGNYERAEKLLQRALVLNPDDSDSNWNLSINYLTQNEFAKGWKSYDYGFKTRERYSRPYAQELDEWHGQPLDGKTILVWGEQGIGDEILFANCLKDLERDAGKVYFDCHPRLHAIFERSFPNIECRPTRKILKKDLFDDVDIDFHAPIGSICKYYRHKIEDFPASGYLRPDPERVEYWKKKIGGQYRVGLSWRGGSPRTQRFSRSLDLDALAMSLPVFDGDPDIQFVSFQYDNALEETLAYNKKFGCHLHHFPAALEGYEETANLAASCDLIVSVITAVIHLAGAMDVPVWCLVPHAPPWKFPPGERMAWHPSIRQFHQKNKYDWRHPVLTSITTEFRKWVEERKLLSVLSTQTDTSDTVKTSSKHSVKTGRKKSSLSSTTKERYSRKDIQASSGSPIAK